MKLGKLALAITVAATILFAANTKNVVDDESIGLKSRFIFRR